MAISLTLRARNTSGNSIVSLIDVGTRNPNGYMEIRSGTKPTSPQEPALGTLLATLSFSNPAFGPFSGGSSTANTIAPDISIDETGTAGWFRIFDRDNATVLDGTITAVGGGGDIEFDNINFVKGGTVEITTIVLTMPNS